MRANQLIRVSAVIGTCATALSAGVTMAVQLGLTPAAVFMDVPAWTTTRRFGFLPVEFVVCAWFLAVTLVYRRAPAKTAASVTLSVGMSAGLVAGFGAWFLLTRYAGCWPVIVATLAAGGVLAGTVIDPETWPESLRHSLTSDLKAFLRSQRARASVTGFLAATALVGSTLHVLAGGVPREAAYERDFRRWYRNQVPPADPDLAAELVGVNTVRVVAFTDYQSKTARNVVPQRTAQAHSVQILGLPVEVVVRDFPMDSSCNDAVAGLPRTAACEAAFAVRLVRRARGEREAERLALWLYSRALVLTSPLIHDHLKELGLLEAFRDQYADLRAAVAHDIAQARRLGVSSAPVYFVNGIRMPEGKGMLLRILHLEREQRGGSAR